MIPTRDEMETMLRCPAWTLGDQHLALSWMKSMRDEIDRLTDENGRIYTELKTARADEAAECERADHNADNAKRLRADLDRANTEAALARDAMAKATTDTRAKVQNELRSVERALCSADVLIKYAAWSRGAYECHVKNTIETAIDALRDDSATTPYSPPFEGDPKDCAFKTTPAPEREAAIRAWEEDATLHRCGSRFDDDDPRATYLMARSEITAAVALMRSAGDPDAKLRELRAWIIDEKWCAPGIVRKIDEMLARPAPSHVYSRGRTIAESAEPPTAYYPPAPVEIWPEEMKRQTLVGKFEPAPVEQPAAAVTDHVPDAGKMVPVLYWLEDGKFARAMLVGKDLLVVDLTFGDGPSVVGKPEWFDAGYVAAYGGLVPESATRGKEPGQWDYGVASIAKPAAAVPDDTRELVAQLADLVAWAMPTMNHHKGVKAIAAKLRGGA